MKSHAYLVKQIDGKLATLAREIEPLERRLEPLQTDKHHLEMARRSLLGQSVLGPRTMTKIEATYEYVAGHPGLRCVDYDKALSRPAGAVYIDLQKLVERGRLERDENKRYHPTTHTESL